MKADTTPPNAVPDAKMGKSVSLLIVSDLV